MILKIKWYTARKNRLEKILKFPELLYEIRNDHHHIVVYGIYYERGRPNDLEKNHVIEWGFDLLEGTSYQLFLQRR